MILTLLLVLLVIGSINVYASEKQKIDVHYFGTEGCSNCMKVESFLDEFVKANRFKFHNDSFSGFEIHFYQVSNKTDYKTHLSYSTHYNLEDSQKTEVPAIFVGDKYLIGEKDIINNFESVMFNYLHSIEEYQKPDIPILSDEEVAELEQDRFENFRLLGVFTAGFLDGFNPCAVAMLLFFITFLTSLKKKNKEILIVGLSFILGTFFCYFIIGLGLFRFTYIFTHAKPVLLTLYSIVVLLSIIIAIQNVREYSSIKKGDFSQIKLQLPKKIKHTIHRIIRNKSMSKALYITAFGMGIVISVLEFACTGQVYLPTIMYILSAGTSMASAYAYLFIYNLAFIIPLATICIVIYSGKEVMEVSHVFIKKMHYIKLSTAIFFFTIAGIMLYQIYAIL